MEKKIEKKNSIISTAITGGIIIAVIMSIGTFGLGRIASNDAKTAVRNVSLLYLSELAGRREQVVSSILDDYIHNLDVALGLITPDDLKSIDSLQAYQAKMKQLYGLEKFAFIDSNGLIYTSRGTRSDIDQYDIDYANLSEPEISVKNLKTNDKKVIIAVPADNLQLEGNTLIACFMEIDMDNMLRDVSLQSNNNTTFCNIYTGDGVALTDMVLGGLASEDNLLGAMKQAQYDSGYTFDELKQDFADGNSGVVSFTYNGISETLYYVPIHGTSWMLTYLIRESIIGEQINSISEGIIFRGLIQSVLTAMVLVGMFILIFIQQRQTARAAIEREVSETENRMKQQELEEQLALQEELLEQEKKRAQQDMMITALASDYRAVYYADLEADDAVCYRRESSAILPYEPGTHFPFLSTLVSYAGEHVAESYRDDFLKFINPAAVKKALEKEKVISIRYLMINEGAESYTILRMAGVRHPSDRVDHTVHAVGFGFADIDEEMRESMAKSEALAEALKSAEDASRAKSSFVSNMSHEIRTPITAILGMNEMIRRESDEENILSYADNINKAGVSLLGIISDILDFSKIEAGRMELSREKYSLRALLNDLYNLIQFRAEAKGLEFRIIADKTLPSGLVGDELRFKQIIANLLTNAVKYTEKGSVCLEIGYAERDNDNARIRLTVSVRDTGIGIKEEEMSKLFAAFDRLDVKRTRSIEGAGLGLAITRQLLGLMDSELKVESVYNEGSRFYFNLWQEISDPAPIGDIDPAVRVASRDKDTEERIFTAPGKRILVVDDMPMNLQVLTGLLKRSKMVIETASGGQECIRRFGENDYDMVFLDYRMPELDGIDTLLKLKELYPEKTAATPIISLTASATAGDRERLLEAGFTDYLSKPVVIPDMEALMNKYLGTAGTEEGGEEAAADGTEGIPGSILDIKELDHESGLKYCGDAEDYVYALRTYEASVGDKADRLEKSLEEKRTDEYVLLIHSLKSMSKSIGAMSLHDKAEALEQAGRNGDIETLNNDTSSFTADYRTLGERLKKAFDEESGESGTV